MLLGIIGGPIGVLLGGSYGTLVGATVDAGDAVYGASMLDQMARLARMEVRKQQEADLQAEIKSVE